MVVFLIIEKLEMREDSTSGSHLESVFVVSMRFDAIHVLLWFGSFQKHFCSLQFWMEKVMKYSDRINENCVQF